MTDLDNKFHMVNCLLINWVTGLAPESWN